MSMKLSYFQVWSYYMSTCAEHCSSISRQNLWMWYRDGIKIMMMMPCLYLLTGSSGITTCVLLQNIVVVYWDMFVTLYRKSGITICVVLQHIVEVYRDICSSLQEVWNYYICTFTKHCSSVLWYVCTSLQEVWKSWGAESNGTVCHSRLYSANSVTILGRNIVGWIQRGEF